MLFHVLTLAGYQVSCLNTRLLRGIFKHLTRDMTSLTTIIKNMCEHYSCVFDLIPATLTLKTVLKH